MRIDNRTKHSKATLARIFALCMARVREDWGADWTKVHNMKVTVTYGRISNFVSGWAFCGRAGIRLHIPARWDEHLRYPSHVGYRHNDLAQAVAATFIHELGHNLGVRRHVEQRTIEKAYEEWIYSTFTSAAFPLDAPAPVKPRPNVQEARYDRALYNLAAAETRVKRAMTLLRKWRRKVRYYERVLPQAALRKGKEK